MFRTVILRRRNFSMSFSGLREIGIVPFGATTLQMLLRSTKEKNKGTAGKEKKRKGKEKRKNEFVNCAAAGDL